MNKKKLIKKLSEEIIQEKYSEWFSEIQILEYIKSFEPKNPIEKRILQRIACIVWWYLKMQKEWFKNNKLDYLLSILKK